MPHETDGLDETPGPPLGCDRDFQSKHHRLLTLGRSVELDSKPALDVVGPFGIDAER